MTTEQYFTHTVTLTDAQLNEKARAIASAMAEINRIEEERKKIAELRKTMKELSREIEEGVITTTRRGNHHWHHPAEGKVHITPVYEDHFEPFTREMTPEELEEHSQIEIQFEEPKPPAKPKDIIFKTAEEEKEWLFNSAPLPQSIALSEIYVARPKYIAQRLSTRDGVKLKHYFEGVYELAYEGRSRKYVRLVEVFKAVSESTDYANLLNLRDKYHDEKPEPTSPAEPKPDGAYYQVEEGTNKFFPWLIRMEVWKDGKFTESKIVYTAETAEKAHAMLAQRKRNAEELAKLRESTTQE